MVAHLPEPNRALVELNRVLRPGGRLFVSAGLAHLLRGAGFDVDSIEWVEGYYGTLSYQCGVAARSLPRRPRDYGGGALGILLIPAMVMSKFLFAAMCQGFTLLELRHKITTRGQCINYSAVARKSVPPSEAPGSAAG